MTRSTLQFPRNPGLPRLILTGQGRELDPRFCLHFQKTSAHGGLRYRKLGFLSTDYNSAQHLQHSWILQTSDHLLGMLLLQIILAWALCHWVYGVESHAFVMTHLAYFPNNISVEMVGDATLDGKLTHSVEYQNNQMNASQLLQLESLDLWEQRKSALQYYLELFKTLVNLYARERKIPYPLHTHCTLGCQIFGNGTNRTFYEVLLNGTDFLRFNAANQSWVPLQETPVASYTSMQLNKYPETSATPAFFLQETCIKIVTEHTAVEGAFTGKHEGRSHTPLVVGLSLGALAVMALALCIFLCTGGKR
ncbi:endothelial protein C receptor-like isoform X2 [Lacerta agilis]|uniref:endothelial protein C receptor-like isoform X2 n=1 Tax=Lacerta agilis TaxID=80427 RepID=UPI00141A2AB9|nr:endothelial protein C receptor-like isoform X2 [Lacerta agilis]